MPLYHKEDIPEDMKHRGIWCQFGQERLFSTFNGGNMEHLVNSDWQCKNCHFRWYYKDVRDNMNAHCPRCGLWIGLKGLKFNGKQKNLEEF